ncbi:hypothetical protein SVIOM342S_00611 [Streptomyces violaceorubidus]
MSGTTTAAAAPGRRAAGAGAHRWVVLVVLCVSLLLVAVDATVLHVAVPAVTEDLRPGAIELLWIVDVYPLVCASLLILSARWATGWAADGSSCSATPFSVWPPRSRRSPRAPRC